MSTRIIDATQVAGIVGGAALGIAASTALPGCAGDIADAPPPPDENILIEEPPVMPQFSDYVGPVDGAVVPGVSISSQTVVSERPLGTWLDNHYIPSLPDVLLVGGGLLFVSVLARRYHWPSRTWHWASQVPGRISAALKR